MPSLRFFDCHRACLWWCANESMPLPLLQVPSFGILATGTMYIFYKYMPDAKRFIKCSTMTLLLKHGITAEEATKESLPVVRRLVHIINEQKNKMQAFKRQK